MEDVCSCDCTNAINASTKAMRFQELRKHHGDGFIERPATGHA
jgi:hypothetical protein